MNFNADYLVQLLTEEFIAESRNILEAVYENPSIENVNTYTQWLDDNGPLRLLEIMDKYS